MCEPVSYGGLVVVPPMVYRENGDVAMSAFGPTDVIQAAIAAVPDPVETEIQAVGGLDGLAQLTGSRLSDRQRAALSAGLELGYYETPRTASQADVADELSCAPSTAAEHLQNGEARLVEAIVGGA